MTRARRSFGVLAAAGMAVALVALPIAFGVRDTRARARALASRPATALPLPADRLPRRLKKLSRFTTRDEPKLAGHREASWSRLAASSWCGGYDLFSLAVGIAERTSTADDLGRALAISRSDLRAALRCGKALERLSRPGRSSYLIEFESAGEGRYTDPEVLLEAIPFDELPPTSSFVRPVDLGPALEKGRCVVGPHAHPGAECLPTAPTAARLTGTRFWVSGDSSEVRAFGREIGIGGGTGDAERLEELARELLEHPTMRVYRDGRAFRRAVVSELFTEPFPYMSLSKESDALDDALRAGFWVGSLIHDETSKRLMTEIVAPNEAEAAKLESALRKYFGTVAERLRGDLPPTLAHGDKPRAVLEAADRDRRLARHAWQKVVIARDRSRIRLETSFEPSDDDRAAEGRRDAELEPVRRAAARLVTAILDDRALPTEFASLLEKGHRPYFEGDWRCRTRGGDDRFVSFEAGRAYTGENRSTPKGAYTYQLRAEWSSRTPAVLRIGDESWEIEPDRQGLTLRTPDRPEQTCARVGAPQDEPEAPATIRFALPKPAEGQTYTPVDFERLGLRVERIDATRSLVCGFDPGHCLCVEPLPCEARGDCPTFDENVAIFEKALQPGQERQVSCERATTGRAGRFRFFDFAGDIYRYEVRWFDSAGRLVGQRNLTDYAEYCDHRTSGRWQGRVPFAEETVRERVICGKVRATLLPPFEDLRNLLGTGIWLDR